MLKKKSDETIYWTSTLYNSSDNINEEIYAIVEEIFNQPLLYNAGSYKVAIERMEITTNNIPLYSGSDTDPESIILTDRGNNATYPAFLIESAYGLGDLLMYVEKQVNAAALGVTATADPLDLSIESSGKILMEFQDNDAFSITLPPRLNRILGLDTTGFTLAPPYEVASKYPRFDMGDELHLIRISSNLPITSDYAGQAKSNIITDVAVPSAFSGGYANSIADDGVSMVSRQKLIYIPTNRRYLDILTPIPISNLRVTADYVMPDGTEVPVKLPPGGIFSLKLGFYTEVHNK
jgi:hypothetical protein